MRMLRILLDFMLVKTKYKSKKTNLEEGI